MKSEAIAKKLREHHLKVTPQRLKIVESLETFGHLNIDMLYSEVKREHPNVSLATVYKNIAIMTDNGLLDEVKVPESKNVYEVKKEQHHHMRCIRCGRIDDVSLPLEDVTRQMEMTTGYRVMRSETVASGICPACQHENA